MPREIAIEPGAMPIRCQLQLAGACCQVVTNSHIVRHALRTWSIAPDEAPAGEFTMQVWVTDAGSENRGEPHFRGLRHIVIASFGAANVFVFDLARRTVVATISEEVAGDRLFWDRLLLPIAMGVLGAAVGVVPVHCACLARDGAALLIAGASGAGKSTLSVALAKSGFTFLSDDWTYLSQSRGQLTAHGMSVPAKLLPDSERFFPFLGAYPIRPALNQELAFELPPQDLGTRVELSCRPRWFFFLERDATGGCRIDHVSAGEAQQYVEHSVELLPPELVDVGQRRTAIMAEMSRLSCWKLRYGGPPDVAVRGLQRFLTQQQVEVPA